MNLPSVPLPIVENILTDSINPIVFSSTNQRFEFATKEQMAELIIATLVEQGIVEAPPPPEPEVDPEEEIP